MALYDPNQLAQLGILGGPPRPVVGAPVLGPGGYPLASGTTPLSLITNPYQNDLLTRAQTAVQNAQPVTSGIPQTAYIPPSAEAPAAAAPTAAGPASSAIPSGLENFASAGGGDALLGGAAGAAPAVEEAAGAAAPGLLKAGPTGLLSAIKNLGGESSEWGSLGDAAKGFGSGELAGLPISIGGNLLGKAIGGKAGRVVSDTSTGTGLGLGVGGALTALLPEELAAGPVGWAAAAAGGLIGGGIALFTHGQDVKSDTHQAYATGWKKIDQYADDLGILNGNLISGAKDAYNSILQAAKDPTDKATQKAALAQVQQSLQQYKIQQANADQQQNNMLAMQAFGQSALAPYLATDDRTATAAQAAYGQLAQAAPNPQARALAEATGAGFAADNAAGKTATVAAANSGPLEYQQQQSLINQYQQQIAAAALAKGQTTGL